MAGTSTQFDLSSDPSEPVLASVYAAESRQFVLANATSQQTFAVQGSMDPAEPPAAESWFNVTSAMVGPQTVFRLTDRAVWYRLAGFGSAGGALAWIGGDEPQTGLMTAATFLAAGEGEVTFSHVVNPGQPRAVGGHVEIVGSAVGTLSCEVVSIVDGLVTVHVRSLQADGTVETGDESAVNVFLQ